jgi:hypothetical protein
MKSQDGLSNSECHAVVYRQTLSSSRHSPCTPAFWRGSVNLSETGRKARGCRFFADAHGARSSLCVWLRRSSRSFWKYTNRRAEGCEKQRSTTDMDAASQATSKSTSYTQVGAGFIWRGIQGLPRRSEHTSEEMEEGPRGSRDRYPRSGLLYF